MKPRSADLLHVERQVSLACYFLLGSFTDLEQGLMPRMECFALHRIGRVKAQEI